MAKKDYTNWDRNDLIKEIDTLRKRKKYGLVWEDKPEDVAEKCKNELPVLVEVNNKEVITDADKPINLLIEGDNYHALSVLNYTHKKKIDVIYIDPPYNTGARDWKYNNDYVDINDSFRHSKWLSMMDKRLRLCKDLLKNDGVLICAIDENEVNRLGLLLEEIFPDRELVTVVIEHNPKGSPTRNFTYTHEYALFVIPKGVSIIGKDPTDKEDTRNLRRAGRASSRKERPTMFYPIYVKNGKIVRVGTPPDGTFHPTGRNTIGENNETVVWPIDDDGKERRWHFGLDSIEGYLERIEVKQSKKGDIQLYVTAAQGRYKSVWTGGMYDAGKYGTALVRDIVRLEFPYPKSLYNTARCLETIINDKPNAIVLDFFAGSGTTGHAVLEMNKKDTGSRRFILCTNNENNICTEVCYPRLANVIKGYKNTQGTTIEGLSGNLKYFRTSFVPADPTDKNKIALTNMATEMLCVKESTFEKVELNGKYQIYKNKNKYMGIIFDHQAIDDFKDKIRSIDGKFSIYIFSLGDDSFDQEFEDIREKVTLSPIPEAILRVYRRIFK